MNQPEPTDAYLAEIEAALRRAPKAVIIRWLTSELRVRAWLRPSVNLLNLARMQAQVETLRARRAQLSQRYEAAKACWDIDAALAFERQCDRLRRREAELFREVTGLEPLSLRDEPECSEGASS